MKKLLLLASILMLQACGKPTMLKVNHDASAKYKSPLMELSTIDFVKPTLKDRRSERTRIGAKKNGYGGDIGDIVTENKVEDIVANAISTGLLKNGHKLTEDGNIKIIGSVDRFWLEMDTNFFTVEFIGDVQCTLMFIDVSSGTEVYRAEYSGHYAEKKAGGGKKTWQSIMSGAVNNLIEDMVFDEDLLEALEAL